MKFILTIFLVIFLLTETSATKGCDWQVRTNGSWGTPQVSWNQTCAQRSWYYPNGVEIPQSDIVCCDFDENGVYTGKGINCPIMPGTVRDPENWPGWHNPGSGGNLIRPQNIEKGKRFFGN